MSCGHYDKHTAPIKQVREIIEKKIRWLHASAPKNRHHSVGCATYAAESSLCLSAITTTVKFYFEIYYSYNFAVSEKICVYFVVVAMLNKIFWNNFSFYFCYIPSCFLKHNKIIYVSESFNALVIYCTFAADDSTDRIFSDNSSASLTAYLRF